MLATRRTQNNKMLMKTERQKWIPKIIVKSSEIVCECFLGGLFLLLHWNQFFALAKYNDLNATSRALPQICNDFVRFFFFANVSTSYKRWHFVESLLYEVSPSLFGHRMHHSLLVCSNNHLRFFCFDDYFTSFNSYLWHLAIHTIDNTNIKRLFDRNNKSVFILSCIFGFLRLTSRSISVRKDAHTLFPSTSFASCENYSLKLRKIKIVNVFIIKWIWVEVEPTVYKLKWKGKISIKISHSL